MNVTDLLEFDYPAQRIAIRMRFVRYAIFAAYFLSCHKMVQVKVHLDSYSARYNEVETC